MLLADYDNAPFKERGLNEDIMSTRLYQLVDLYRLVSTFGDFQIVDTGEDIFEGEPSGPVGSRPELRLRWSELRSYWPSRRRDPAPGL